MVEAWLRVKIPRIIHVCCGYKYDTKNINTIEYFRCFAHKSQKEKILNQNNQYIKVSFCITVWLVCKNNECITSFTFYYDNHNKLIKNIKVSGLKYLLNLKEKFLANIPLNIKIKKIEPKSNKYLWKYTDRHPTKQFVSNIYTLDDNKVGETLPQNVTIYKI